MRVTNSMMYRNFTSSTNTVHSRLNKSFNKISTGSAYETAADSPLSYYQSKKIDTQFMDVESKRALIKDVQNRIYQQELGARDIQTILTGVNGAENIIMRARTGTTTGTALDTLSADLLQKQHSIVNDLNAQYQDFYVYGGNDLATPPFSLSADGTELTFSHIFPGETETTVIKMGLIEDVNNAGTYKYEILVDQKNNPPEYPKGPYAANATDAEAALARAMSEQGRVDVGVGTIRDHSTLMDTFTGGLNLLTGLTSDAVKLNTDSGKTPYSDSTGGVLDYLNKSALGLIGQAKQAIDKYGSNSPDADPGQLDETLGRILGEMTMTEHNISTVYSDLGTKYNLMDTTYDSLGKLGDSLKEQYSDIMGADAYESIIDMWENQYSYNASLKLGAQLMSSSLFDFMR